MNLKLWLLRKKYTHIENRLILLKEYEKKKRNELKKVKKQIMEIMNNEINGG